MANGINPLHLATDDFDKLTAAFAQQAAVMEDVFKDTDELASALTRLATPF